MSEVVIRSATLDDLVEARDVVATAGWTLEKNLLSLMMKIDPEGIVLAEDSVKGGLVGVFTAFNVADDLCFLGQYVVRQAYRGRGIGYRLWQALMPHASDRNIGLDAAAEMESVYRDKSGFKHYATYRIARYIGKPSNVDSLLSNVAGVKVVSIKDVSLASLIKYDQDVTHIDRSRFLQLAVEEPETDWLAAVEVNDHLVGFGRLAVSNLDTGLIGPLYANSSDVAEVLFRELVQREPLVAVNGLFVDAPSTNGFMAGVLARIGMNLVDSLPFMFTKCVPRCDVDRIFAFTNAGYFPF